MGGFNLQQILWSPGGARIGLSVVYGSLGVHARPEAEVEAKLYQVGDVTVFFVGDGGHGGHNGLDNARGGRGSIA